MRGEDSGIPIFIQERMRNMRQYRWLAIINEHAGKKEASQKWPMLHEKLLAGGVTIDAQVTEKAGDAITMTGEALRNGYTGIIAVGGDGTLNEVLNGFWQDGNLINPEAVLTFVNMGTGGDFSRTIAMNPFGQDSQTPGMSNNSRTPDAEALADRLVNGRLQKMDIGQVRFGEAQQESRYYINGANVGVGAETVRRVNEQDTKPGGGHISYMITALSGLMSFKPRHLRVVVDGECKMDEKLYAVMVCNGRFIGAGMMITPHAQLTDGKLDVVTIQKMSLIRLLRNFLKIYKGTHLGVKGVSCWQGSRIEVSEPELPASGHRSIVEVDGEILGYCPASYTSLSRAVTMWLPEETR